jgi:hypothetical protein
MTTFFPHSLIFDKNIFSLSEKGLSELVINKIKSHPCLILKILGIKLVVISIII